MFKIATKKGKLVVIFSNEKAEEMQYALRVIKVYGKIKKKTRKNGKKRIYTNIPKKYKELMKEEIRMLLELHREEKY